VLLLLVIVVSFPGYWPFLVWILVLVSLIDFLLKIYYMVCIKTFLHLEQCLLSIFLYWYLLANVFLEIILGMLSRFLWYVSLLVCLFFLSLYFSNSLTNSTWIWFACFSISPCIISHSFPNMLNISLPVCILYMLFAYKMMVLISVSWVFATLANWIIFCNWWWMLAIISNPLIIL